MNHKNIHVTHGIVTFQGYSQCSIQCNGQSLTSSTGSFPGWHYGLVNYSCDNITGLFVSKMTCKDCGLYCIENEQIEGCERSVVPLLVGGFIGMILALLSIVIYKRLVSKLVAQMTNSITEWYQKRAEHRNRKRATKIVKYFKTDKDNVSIHRSRSPSPASLLAGALLLSGVQLGSTCDNTLFMTSEGHICETTHCIKTKVYEVSIMSGSKLCFRDTKGDILSMKTHDSQFVYRSNFVYYASDFELETKAKSMCKGVGICWNGDCFPGRPHPDLKQNNTRLEISGYGCDTDSLGCDGWCWHKTACTYYRWSVKPKGELYPIYKIITKYWQTKLTVTYKNKSNVYNFNVNNPQINLDHVDILRMPIMITNFNSQDNVINSHMMRVGDRFINVDAADYNMPEGDKVGDFQVSTDKQSSTYNEHLIQCQVNSCNAYCNMPQPRVLRALAHLERYNSYVSEFRFSKDTLISYDNVKSSVRLLVGNVEFNNLKVSPAHCNFEVLSTFSCKSCDLQSYAVIAANNIKEEGIMRFTSNCTFDRDYISCNSEPYKLEVVGSTKSCTIFIPSTNTSFNIDFNFTYLGSLDPSKNIFSKSTDIDDIINLISSDNFFQSVGLSWIGFCLATTLITTLIRYCRPACMRVPAAYYSYRATRNNNDNV